MINLFFLFTLLFANISYGSLYNLHPKAARDAFEYKSGKDTKYYKNVVVDFDYLDSFFADSGGLVFVFTKFINKDYPSDIYPTDYPPSCEQKLYNGLSVYLKKNKYNPLLVNQNGYDLAVTIMNQATLIKDSGGFLLYSRLSCFSQGYYNSLIDKITVEVRN